ncbi:PREDICTED: uncharacterized protein LOC108356749, partial [Rhagoletis zephyria]|uniref:uncharacterized protein LOC108356749 n=1 Tax=Rhagoletis zephyria TaxID=28612 RepID=UPI0008112F42
MDFLSASNGNLRLAVNLFYQSNQKVSAKDEHEEDASSTVGPKTSTPKASTAKGRFKAAVGKVGKMVKKMVGGGASGTGKMSVRRRGQAKEQTSSASSTSASSSSMRKSKQNAAADDDADDLDSSPELRAPDQPKKEVLLELEEEGEGQGRGHEENAVGLGQQLAGFYQVNETPFVALLDPRTGEKLLSWSAGNEQLACAEVWCNAVDDFLRSQGEHLLKKEVVAPLKTNAAAKSSVLDVQAMSEEEQLKAAIEASLRDLQLQQKNQPEVKKASVVGVSSSSSWKQYLGPENSGKQSLQFVIRLPDGSRRPVSFPADSK